MTFLADESVDDPIVEELRSIDLNILYIKEISPGVDDEMVLELAKKDERILITMDKDFGELVYRDKHFHAGVILIRMDGFTPFERAEQLRKIVLQHKEELKNAFTVVQHNLTRIRK